MSTTINPEVAASFRCDGSGGFISRTLGWPVACPPFVIAFIAANRVPPGTLKLPEGYDPVTLEQVKAATGFPDREVRISGRQAAELAQIGRQILAHSDEVDGGLSYFEQQSVEHLVRMAASPGPAIALPATTKTRSEPEAIEGTVALEDLVRADLRAAGIQVVSAAEAHAARDEAETWAEDFMQASRAEDGRGGH